MKRRFFLMLALCFVLPLMALLSSCGETPVSLTGINVEYKDGTYTFDAQQPLEITYSDELNLFVKSDFVVHASYDNGTTATITDFNFSLVKIGGGQDAPATDLLPGSYRVTISYQGETINLDFSVRAIALSENNVSKQMASSTPYVVNGKAEPEVAIVYHTASQDKPLTLGIDYDLAYGDNNYVGQNAGSVTVTFKGKYSGEIIYYFDITPLQIGEVVFNNVNTTYDGTDKQSLCVIDFTNPPIVGVTDIEYKYYTGANLDEEVAGDVKDAGEYKVVAHLVVADGYAQPNDMTFTLTIAQQDISGTNLSDIGLDELVVGFKNGEYSHLDFAEEVETALANLAITYNLSTPTASYVDNLNVSTDLKHGQFVITGTGNYKGQINVPFTILPASFSVSDMLLFNMNSNIYTYNGTAQTLREVHYYWNGWVELTTDDYTVDYNESNIQAGTCTFTVTGKGNYTGSKVGTFVISKADYEVESISWSTSYLTYNGKDQISAVYITDLDDVLEADYEAHQDNIENGGYKIVALKNAGYYTVEASIYFAPSAKDTYGNSYALNYNLNILPSMENLVQINQKLATATLNGPSSFTYTGSVINPDRANITVSAVLDGKTTTLVEDVDYTLTFPDDSINVYDGENMAFYYVDVYDKEGNFFFDMGGTRSDYYPLTYNITPKELWFSGISAPATINYPTVYKNLWNDTKYIGDGNAYVRDVALNVDITDEMQFEVITDEDTYVRISAKSYSNYSISSNVTDKQVTVSVINPYFSKFKLRNEYLTNEQIDSLSKTGFILGDGLQITLNSGYVMEMGGMVNGGTVTYGKEYRSTPNIPIIGVTMGRYPQSGTHSAVSTMHYFLIREDIGDFPTARPAVAYTQVDIDVDVFETFTVGSVDMVNHSDWSNFFNLTSLKQDDLLDMAIKENKADKVKFKVSLQVDKYSTMPLTDGERTFQYLLGSHFESKIIFQIGDTSCNGIKREFTLDTEDILAINLDESYGSIMTQLVKDNNYFTFTTDSSESDTMTYVLLSNNPNVDYAIMKSAEDEYSGRCGFGAVYNSRYSYYVLPRLTAETEYTLLVHAQKSDEEATTLLRLMQYREDLTFEILDANYDILEEPRVACLNKEASEEVFIPQEIYDYSSDSLFEPYHFTIKAIAPYAFCNTYNGNDFASTMEAIEIPSTIISIGAHAFDGCSSLEYIYYDGTGSDWKKITMGDYPFSSCSPYLALVCLDNVYYLSSNGSITSLEDLHSECGSLMSISLDDLSISLVFGTDDKVACAQAIKEEGHFVTGSVDFVGKTPLNAIKAFIDFAYEQGYFIDNPFLSIKWTLTSWFENTMGSIDSYLDGKVAEKNISLGLISKKDLVELLVQYYPQFEEDYIFSMEEEDVSLMPLRDIFQMVIDYKTSISNFENESIVQLFNVVCHYSPIVAQMNAIKSHINPTNSDEEAHLDMCITALNQEFDEVKSTYFKSLPTFSSLMLMKSTMANNKMYLLSIMKSADNPDMVSYLKNYYLPMLNFSIEMMNSSISMMTTSMDSLLENINYILMDFDISSFEEDVMNAFHLEKYACKERFMSEFGSGNVNVWTGSNIFKEGTRLFVYHVGTEYTYTINKYTIDMRDAYICYVYEGNIGNFDDVNPIRFYQCEYNTAKEFFIVLNGANMVLAKVGTALEEIFVGDESITYLTTEAGEVDEMSMVATTVFANSGLVYMLIGSYTKEQIQGNYNLHPITVATWTQVDDKLLINGAETYIISYDESDLLHENPILTLIIEEHANEIYYYGGVSNISLCEGRNEIYFEVDSYGEYHLTFSEMIEVQSIALYADEETPVYIHDLEISELDDNITCEIGNLNAGEYVIVIEIESGYDVDDIDIEIISLE